MRWQCRTERTARVHEQAQEMRKRRPAKLDALDRRILLILQQQARITNIELAERVGLSPSACLQRTKALEDSGCILKYVGVVDLDRLFRHVKLYVLITLTSDRPDCRAMFEEAIAETPEFVDCLCVNGGVDYIGLVVCSTITDYNRLTEELLSRELGIRQLASYTVIDTAKWFGGYPFGRLAWKS
jgi:Lrp/AsnC family transcriptional regulator, leucine-responsive regulatory protein